MKRSALLFQSLLLGGMGLSAQEGPNLFQLWLPDFFETAFASGNALIEVPDRQIKSLRILVRDAQKRNINPGRYKLFVNGKGMGNVFEERTVPEGTLLVMEPEALRKRPDELFDLRENAIEISATNKAGRQFYQNWVVRVNEMQRNSLFGYSSMVSADDPKGVPPDLILSEPAGPIVLAAKQASAKVTLKGSVSRGAALKVNGQPVTIPSGAAIAPFEFATTVAATQKELLLEATDGKGNRRSILIPVHTPANVVRAPKFAGQKYAIIIGISKFGSSKETLPVLELAAAEAEVFAQDLEKQAGFKHENIRLLTDEKATLEQVRVAFSDFAAKAQTNDMLVIYVATHGIHDPRPGRGDKLYLALNGTQIAQIESTALNFSDLELYLNRSVRTNQCFLIFDIGHKLPQDWQFLGGKSLVNNHVLNLFGSKPGWSVLVSGSSDQQSQPRGTGTLFNHWLTQALGGKADLNGDQVVTAKELFTFVSEKVKVESEGAQMPRFRLAANGGEQAIR